MTMILMVGGARVVISFCILSATPGNMVLPPDRMVLAYRSFPDVDVALHDGVVSGLVDTCGLHAQERGLEQGL